VIKALKALKKSNKLPKQPREMVLTNKLLTLSLIISNRRSRKWN